MGTVAPFRRRAYPRRETSVIDRTRRWNGKRLSWCI